MYGRPVPCLAKAPCGRVDCCSGLVDDMRASRNQAIDRLARKRAAYGRKHSELGAVILCVKRGKKSVFWVPPT